ncbi:MAG TPA: dialkylresorcinol condensing enzyme [Steroidobacteraceae bacterium]|nr:dialkylresorcinol condensing enzyme [Steroidobacteraceae bacterium]
MKRVLVIWYSQSGQLRDIVESIAQPLSASKDVELTLAQIKPATPYPFPWGFWRFFDTFPECIYADPAPVQPLEIAEDAEFDLVIIAYQVWFISPSLPTTAFLQSEQAKRLLNGKPVITVIGCRNMWLMAQERMKELLNNVGARLIDNVALAERTHGAISVITTPWWLLSGSRGPYLGGLLPRAGVWESDIRAASRFGTAIALQLDERDAADAKPMLSGLGAVTVHPGLISSEMIVRRSFRMWGKLLRACGKPGAALRRVVLGLYVVFLVAMLLTIVPVVFVLKTLLTPLTRKRIARQREYFAAPSGESMEKIIRQVEFKA